MPRQRRGWGLGLLLLTVCFLCSSPVFLFFCSLFIFNLLYFSSSLFDFSSRLHRYTPVFTWEPRCAASMIPHSLTTTNHLTTGIVETENSVVSLLSFVTDFLRSPVETASRELALGISTECQTCRAFTIPNLAKGLKLTASRITDSLAPLIQDVIWSWCLSVFYGHHRIWRSYWEGQESAGEKRGHEAGPNQQFQAG